MAERGLAVMQDELAVEDIDGDVGECVVTLPSAVEDAPDALRSARPPTMNARSVHSLRLHAAEAEETNEPHVHSLPNGCVSISMPDVHTKVTDELAPSGFAVGGSIHPCNAVGMGVPRPIVRACTLVSDSIMSVPYSEADDAGCRICRASDETKRLFSPCLCSGSVGLVHEECLKQWLDVSKKKTEDMKCEICHYQYVIKFTTKPFKQWKRISVSQSESRRLKIYLASYIVAGFTLSWTVSSFLIPLLGADSKNFAFYFKLFLMIFCWVVWAVLFYLHGKFYAVLIRKLKMHNRAVVIMPHHIEPAPPTKR